MASAVCDTSQVRDSCGPTRVACDRQGLGAQVLLTPFVHSVRFKNCDNRTISVRSDIFPVYRIAEC
jgi:hypothetical protein